MSADEKASQVSVIVGTAGHVDHGKSSLVLALTGTDPDRLPQEKARGITIDLGFAELGLPSGRQVGLVDVPGHEHYVRAMVAGAAGVDVALLVVAADDGVMPQTREHLHILEIMGATQMVVALTKADLVEPDWLELVQMDLEEFLEGTRFAGSPVVPVSSRTGEGLPELLEALDAAADAFAGSEAAAARLERPARLSVDRAFNVAGVGAVVTGTLRSGVLSAGDAVDVLPAGVRAKVRSVQTHGRDVQSAHAGQRTALNLSGVGLDDVPRGATVCAPGSLSAHDRFDATIHWFGRDREDPAPLVSGERVHVCVGTSQALGRVLLFDGATELAAGQDALVQIRLEEPLVLSSQDRYVVMAFSPVELVGGGTVLWANPPRRTAPSAEDRALLAALKAGDEREAARAVVARSSLPMGAPQVAASLDLAPARAADLLGALAADGVLEVLGSDAAAVYAAPALLDGLSDAMVAVLRDDHGLAAAGTGVSVLALRDRVAPRMEPAAFNALVARAEGRGLVGRFGSGVVAGEDVERLRREADELVEKVAKVLDSHGAAVPFVEELAGEAGLDEPTLRRGLTMLCDAGRAVAVDRSYVMGKAAHDGVCRTVADTIRAGGGEVSAGELREALGLSRKYAMPLLEHLDKIGFTVRSSDGQGARSLAKP